MRFLIGSPHEQRGSALASLSLPRSVTITSSPHSGLEQRNRSPGLKLHAFPHSPSFPFYCRSGCLAAFPDVASNAVANAPRSHSCPSYPRANSNTAIQGPLSVCSKMGLSLRNVFLALLSKHFLVLRIAFDPRQRHCATSTPPIERREGFTKPGRSSARCAADITRGSRWLSIITRAP
jgi:hypothetical protein